MFVSRIIRSFSAKSSGFFWNDINPCVKAAEYAVRGVVPTQATLMQEELKKKTKSTCWFIKPIHSTKSPFAT